MRTEPCACGGCITAPSLRQAAPYVEGHNATMLHQMWRVFVGIVAPSRPIDPDIFAELIHSRPPTYRDPRRPTASTNPRDVSGSTTGTSGVEGAA